jgi:hypothetical protein
VHVLQFPDGAVGDFRIVTVGVIQPAVKRTTNCVALNATTHSEVRSHMRAIRVKDVHLAGGAPIGDQLLIEVAETMHLTDREVKVPSDDKPAVGHNTVWVLSHGAVLAGMKKSVQTN